jgi:membrane-bound lytic murein transglycosylase D
MEEQFLMTPTSTSSHRGDTSRLLRLTLLSLATLLISGCATVTMDAPGASRQDTASTTEAPQEPAARSVVRENMVTGPLSAIESASPGGRPPIATLAAPSDLWDRIRRGFAMNDLDNELVRDREQWYSSRPDYIQRMTERSSRYLFHIVEEIERRNMPMELALLPFIESAFNPKAVSSARAAGMWQFMPATGQAFDLKQNIFRDDRRDVLASTRAALDYLQQLHDRFGDWHLALAAYNWGQGNVNRAITRNQRDGQATGYTDLDMPAETRQYVPKLQAVKNIIANPQTFNTELPLIGNHPFFDTVTLERDMDVALIARLSAITEQDFRELNPSLKQPMVMAAGNPHILLPWDSATTFLTNLNQYQGQLASWTVWAVPSTMSAASAAKHVGMSESELREVNNIPPRMLVRAGSSLLVPRNGKQDRDVSEQAADNGHLNLQPEMVLRRVSVKARKGESLSTLSRRYGVSVASVAGWNKLSESSRLKTGQRITLMLPKAASGRTASASSSKRSVAAKSGTRSRKTASSGKRKDLKAVSSKRSSSTSKSSGSKSKKKVK